MIRKLGIKKFLVTSMSLLIIAIYSILPSNDIINNFNILEEKKYNDVVYLLDRDNYISRVDTFIEKKDINSIIESKINLLINGTNNFKNIIPSLTKINNIEVIGDKVTVDFSKEIFSVKKEFTRGMIEAIIYSLTEINGINDIYLKNDGILINKINDLNIKYPLNRSYGINIEYDIFNLNNINKTTVFFVKEVNDESYYVPITKVSNNDDEKIFIVLEELKSSVNSQNNLNSYVSNELLLSEYEKSNNTMNLIFNDYIFESINSNRILEEVKYTISLSIMENYDVNEVIFNTNNKSKIEIFKDN